MRARRELLENWTDAEKIFIEMASLVNEATQLHLNYMNEMSQRLSEVVAKRCTIGTGGNDEKV